MWPMLNKNKKVKSCIDNYTNNKVNKKIFPKRTFFISFIISHIYSPFSSFEKRVDKQ